MKYLLKLEEFALFIAASIIFFRLENNGLLFLQLLFTPDISILAYLINPRIGAYVYNFVHHKALALIIIGIGWHFQIEELILIGLIFFAHSSMDRVLGYGLKYLNDFKNTHLGWIGIEENPVSDSK